MGSITDNDPTHAPCQACHRLVAVKSLERCVVNIQKTDKPDATETLTLCTTCSLELTGSITAILKG